MSEQHSNDICQLDGCYGQRPDCGYRRSISAVDSMPMPDPVEAMREWQRRELEQARRDERIARAMDSLGEWSEFNTVEERTIIEDSGHVFEKFGGRWIHRPDLCCGVEQQGKDGITNEWDIDNNLPMYTRDFYKLYSIDGHLCDCHRGDERCFGCESLDCKFHSRRMERP